MHAGLFPSIPHCLSIKCSRFFGQCYGSTVYDTMCVGSPGFCLSPYLGICLFFGHTQFLTRLETMQLQWLPYSPHVSALSLHGLYSNKVIII